MTRAALTVAVTVALTGCPAPVSVPDAGVIDAGITTITMSACSGGCGVTQICDTANRICVDACGVCGSDGGASGVCQKTSAGGFACVPTMVSCGGTTCDEGQVACEAGACTCLGPARGTLDTCFGDPTVVGAPGEVCVGNVCANPREFQQCVNGGAVCPTGLTCVAVFSNTQSLCTRPCPNQSVCDTGEVCSQQGCLPSGLFSSLQCQAFFDGGYGADGGDPDDGGQSLFIQQVAVGSLCLLEDQAGDPLQTAPTGTCTYAFFYLADEDPTTVATCRPPGDAVENQDCTQDRKRTSVPQQCGPGLECALARGGDTGMCMRACNALEATRMYPDPEPQCAGADAGEVCVNLYHQEDINNTGGLMGVCTLACNVFDPVTSKCPAFGTTPASCVPAAVDGRLLITPDGAGVCMPQHATLSALGATCDQSDPFRGAECATGQLCPPVQPDAPAVCTQLCDTTCAAVDGGGTVPARCATEVNAMCPGGKTCTVVNSGSTARMGFCL